MNDQLWQPSEQQKDHALLSRFIEACQQHDNTLTTVNKLYQWSVDNPELFWQQLSIFCDIQFTDTSDTIIQHAEHIKDTVFFPHHQLNYAQNCLSHQGDEPAIIFNNEVGDEQEYSFKELGYLVAQCAAALRHDGVKPGDRVAAIVPNIPQSIIAMLATASIGAVWSSCSPDFGVEGILDRFQQIKPTVLIGVDGYYYNGKHFDCQTKISDVSKKLDSLTQTVVINYTGSKELTGLNWSQWLDPFDGSQLVFESVGFNDPLFILFSSGTTGKPKCIVHGVGGTLIQHLKEHQLHCDIQPFDRVFYFTTCGWMMWNWLASALASKATIMLYDGAPTYPQPDRLWHFAADNQITHFGTSAKYIDALNKAHYDTGDLVLSSLRVILSTGSPLSPENFDYVYEHLHANICLASISGGTDIVSCFALSNPLAPVYRGELQMRGLGMAVDVFNENGQPVTGERGELVCKNAFPCMPIYFWNDKSGEKYFDAYFNRFENTWTHGDYVELTERGGLKIYGRSDTTLNPGGVRIGTAEIYRQVERFDEILESLVVGRAVDSDIQIILFVVCREGVQLTASLIHHIKTHIKTQASPRHVPAHVIQVTDLPRTRSGKLSELAVKDCLEGRDPKNTSALANPEALEQFRQLTL